MPERYVPKDWSANKFAAELWMQRALAAHPWRVDNVEQADLLFLEANLSLACRVGKMFSGRAMWKHMGKAIGMGMPIGKRGERSNGSMHPRLQRMRNSTPAAFVLTDNECPPPWIGMGLASWPTVMVKDHGPGKHDVIAPFVLSRPAWLVGRNSVKQAPRVVPWHDRKLLFFAGHVPKLYIKPTRYFIWKQIRRWPNVTAISATINCTVGSMAACNEFKNCSDKFVHTFCIPFCKSHVLDDLRVNMNDQPYHFRHFKLPTEPSIRRCGRGRLALLKQCKSYKGVNYVEEAADMAAATRNLPAQEYFANAMGHRFCLAAPGDFVSTPKITEYVAMGAAGGCLPLMVLAGDPWKTLP
ncbi:MAG: hypothetical protein SGPRY_008890 [Prymnesium sp.]